MERIEHLERENKRWRLLSISALLALLVMMAYTGYSFSQREPQKPLLPPEVAAGNQAFKLDRTRAVMVYSNFCHVTYTPEELILDLGLNTQEVPADDSPVQISNRVVVNFYTAKRLAIALQQTVQMYEARFGPIELDYQKRAKTR